MEQLSVNKFRANIKDFVDKAISNHEPIRVTRRGGKDFIVISAEDFDREIETVYVLQNKSLMNQIQESLQTYSIKTGYKPSQEEADEILSV